MSEDDEILRGADAIAAYLGMTSRNLKFLKERKVDPVPLRYALDNLWAMKSRLDLWKLREPFYNRPPNLEIPILWGRETIGQAVGLVPRTLYHYTAETAPFGMLPIWKHKGRDWAYRDAIVDWLDSQSMGVAVRAALLKAKRGLVVEPEES